MLFHDPPINSHKDGTMISVSPMIPLLIPEVTFSKEQKKGNHKKYEWLQNISPTPKRYLDYIPSWERSHIPF